MFVPRRLGMSICISAQWRGAIDYPPEMQQLGLSPWQCDLFMAFRDCIAASDEWIRNNAAGLEGGTVVAEENHEMRKFLQDLPRKIREEPWNVSVNGGNRWTISDLEQGYQGQSGDKRVTRIRNSIHFVGKRDEPLVQVADACAFGIRRFLGQNDKLARISSQQSWAIRLI